MLDIKDIEKLAKLARIRLTDEEKGNLLKEIDSILGYVAQLKEVTSNIGDKKKAGEHRNVIREDSILNERGFVTKEIVKNMPDSENNFLKVKKIM